MTTDRLTLLGLSDLHGALLDWDYVTDAPLDPPGGLARLASVVAQVEREGTPTLLFDVGDTIQGTPAMALCAADGDPGGPLAGLLGRLGVRAAALGNHDLDYGPEALGAYAERCPFPLLGANIAGLPGISAPFLIEVDLPSAGRIKVGVLGLTTPGTLVWNGSRLTGEVRGNGIVETAATEVPQLREAGADVVVVLSHAGLGPSSTYGDALPWAENDTRRLMREVPGIDAVLLGHAHVDVAGLQRCAATGADVPYAEPGSFGRRLARINLHIERQDGRVRVTGSEAQTLPTGGHPQDDEVVATARALHERTRGLLERVVGSASEPVTARPIEQGPSPATDLVNQVQSWHITRVLAGTEWSALRVLSTTAMPIAHHGIEPGPIQVRDLYRVCPFDNTLDAVVISGAELYAYLEHDARYFGPETVPAYNLDSLGSGAHEVSYVIDRGAPSDRRVTDLRIDGDPVRPDERIVLAMTSYRSAGGGGFPATAANPPVVRGDREIKSLLEEWLREHDPVSLADIIPARWSVR